MNPNPPQPAYLPAGWYPTGPNQETYWDGHTWTPYRRTPPESVMEPILGWVLAAFGLVMVIASFMPWASGLGGLVTKSGIDGGDGWISLVIGLAILAVGIAVGLKQGLVWAPIVGTLLGLVAGGLAVFEINDVSGRAEGVDIGYGLWIMAIAALGAIVVAACGFGVKTSDA
jgi:hypothetical protein